MTRFTRHKILCVMQSSHHLEELRSLLEDAHYEVINGATADQAVGFSMNHSVASVVIDSEFLTEDWTLAQTLKSLRPTLPIFLFAEAHCEVKVPQVLDAVVRTHSDLLGQLRLTLETNSNANSGDPGSSKDGL